MSGLIKENSTQFLIDMARLRLFTLLGFIFISVLLLSSVQTTKAFATVGPTYTLSQNQPDVWAWGIEGDPLMGLGFDVWANVTDEDADLKNVSVQVNGPNMTLNSLMTFNGTLYTGAVPAFPNDGLFDVYILAYDTTNRSRTSSNVQYDFESDPVIPIDPNLTMPVVVISSIGLVAVVIGLAFVYDKKQTPGE
jgi:hypothetical protein